LGVEKSYGKSAPKIDEEVRRITSRIQGRIGVAAKTFDDKDLYLYNEHMQFPAASTIKIHVLLELFNQTRSGKRSFQERLKVPTSDRLGPLWDRRSSGILKDLESITEISLRDAATLMIIVSDNVATNLIMDLLGIENIQRMVQQLGLKDTKIQRKMMDYGSAAKGLENVTSPYDMMITLEKIANKEVLEEESCEAILDILSRAQDTLGLRRLIPADVRIEHKTGELDDVCNDVGIVRAAETPFVIAVLSKGVNMIEGWDAIAEIGKLFFGHYALQEKDTS